MLPSPQNIKKYKIFNSAVKNQFFFVKNNWFQHKKNIFRKLFPIENHF